MLLVLSGPVPYSALPAPDVTDV
ncbi:MAG: hypothetical protein QOI86_4615, partial [Actinomycetota bacterium]|nr:hypothetical protein [Actinomycetota bacterium]